MALYAVEQPPLVVPGGTGWFDAFDTATGAVASWTNKANSQAPLTQGTGAKQPICTASQINGKNAVLFSGSHTLVVPASVRAIAASDNTAFIVFTSSDVADKAVTSFTRPGFADFYGMTTTTQNSHTIFFSNAAGTNGVTLTGADRSVYGIYCMGKSGAVQSISYNNATPITNNSASNANVNESKVGSFQDASSYLTGGIAEMIFYPYALTASQTLYLYRYLSNKYGILIS